MEIFSLLSKIRVKTLYIQKYTQIITVKSSLIIITHGRTENLHREAFTAGSFILNTVLYTKQNVHSRPKPESPVVSEGLNNHEKWRSKQPKQPKPMRVFQAATTNH